MTRATPPPPWTEQAACARVDPELWFPERGSTPRPARRICTEVCTVTTECLEYALADPALTGVWGGTTSTQRKRIRVERERAA